MYLSHGLLCSPKTATLAAEGIRRLRTEEAHGDQTDFAPTLAAAVVGSKVGLADDLLEGLVRAARKGFMF